MKIIRRICRKWTKMERIRKLPIKGLQYVGKYGKIKSVKRLLL